MEGWPPAGGCADGIGEASSHSLQKPAGRGEVQLESQATVGILLWPTGGACLRSQKAQCWDTGALRPTGPDRPTPSPAAPQHWVYGDTRAQASHPSGRSETLRDSWGAEPQLPTPVLPLFPCCPQRLRPLSILTPGPPGHQASLLARVCVHSSTSEAGLSIPTRLLVPCFPGSAGPGGSCSQACSETPLGMFQATCPLQKASSFTGLTVLSPWPSGAPGVTFKITILSACSGLNGAHSDLQSDALFGTRVFSGIIKVRVSRRGHPGLRWGLIQ